MTSLGEVVANIDRILVQVSNASAWVASAESLWIDAAEQLSSALAGSEMAEAGELAQLDDLTKHRFADVRTGLGNISDQITTYRTKLLAPRSASAPVNAAEQVASEVVTARDGSCYPPSSGWCADMLPPRVVANADHKTVGYVAHSLSAFVSGRDGTWSPAIQRRMAELGVDYELRRKLPAHVEFKVATMMITENRRRCELTINHSPCGSQPPWRPGCHQVLEQYLPKGFTLVVYGTTQQGRSYSHVYEGKA